MFLSLFVDFVNTCLPKDLVLPFQIVPLAGEQLVEEAKCIRISQRSHQDHESDLSQSYVGMIKSLVCQYHLTPPSTSLAG